MFLLLVSLGMALTPMSNGYHHGWRNKKTPRDVPSFQQVATPATPGGNISSDQNPDGPMARRFAD